MAALWRASKRLLVGSPRRSSQLAETLLPKWLALPVFCSDPLSSNAYATEEILLVLGVGGLAFLGLTPVVAAFVIILLLLVVASYRQTCRAYPNGGGAYSVSKDNFGDNAALVAAASLLIDYVLTVAVSVVAGVANIVSAFPQLDSWAVWLAVGLVAVLALMNLRGVRESGTAFAIPTYGFIATVMLMLGVGLVRVLAGSPPIAESAGYVIQAQQPITGLAVIVLLLRSFASGCTALTGVEAVSNGVPNFRPERSRNAAATLTIMAVITVIMFAGITALAMSSHVHIAEDPSALVGAPADYVQRTVIAQLAAAVFGSSSIGFFAVQVFTALVLILAANTAFNGFPILASILGRDGFFPRQFGTRGDKLVFSNGIIVLAGASIALIIIFDASVSRLIQLYIIGVFVSFTLSQFGMVRHWNRLLRSADRSQAGRMRRSRLVNALGGAATSVVLVVVLVSKFSHGAWIVVLAMPVIFLVMKWISSHYARVTRQLHVESAAMTLPARVHALVLVARLNAPALRALAYARATRPSTLVAVTVQTAPEESIELEREWADLQIPVSLTVLDSPYRDITRSLVDYIQGVRRTGPRDIVVVYVPEYVVEHWWENFLHNQSAFRLKTRLLFVPGVLVTSVPWQLGTDAPTAAQLRPEEPRSSAVLSRQRRGQRP